MNMLEKLLALDLPVGISFSRCKGFFCIKEKQWIMSALICSLKGVSLPPDRRSPPCLLFSRSMLEGQTRLNRQPCPRDKNAGQESWNLIYPLHNSLPSPVMCSLAEILFIIWNIIFTRQLTMRNCKQPNSSRKRVTYHRKILQPMAYLK